MRLNSYWILIVLFLNCLATYTVLGVETVPSVQPGKTSQTTQAGPQQNPVQPQAPAQPPVQPQVQMQTQVVKLGPPNIEAGKQIALTVCAPCHNVDGNSTNPVWPKLAGQYPAYLVKQLKEYKMGETGPRFDPQMIGMVANLNEQDMVNVSAYFASQKQTPGKALSNYVKLGEKIYKGGNPESGVSACSACHGPRGAGNILAKYPKVSGQQPEYMQAQLKAFKDKKRRNDINGIMQDIAKRMTDEEIMAVSQYMAGLH